MAATTARNFSYDLAPSSFSHPRVVVVGAGFGGLKVAKDLAGREVSAVLVDQNNFHTFLPLLYQVGAAEIDADSIGYPLRGLLRKLKNVRFVMARVQGADLDRQILKTDGPDIPYDYLVLAAGSVSHFFNVPGAQEYALPLKTLEEGTALRSHILERFEWASHQTDEAARRRALTFTIVGGGPTGVEFAGALAELVYRPLVRDFPTLDFREVRIVLVEGGDNLLGGFPENLQSYACRRLHDMGIELRLSTVVSKVTESSVEFKDGSQMPTETVIWTGGVRGNPLAAKLGLPLTRNGRVQVLPTLQVPGHPRMYAIGDMAQVEDGGAPLPMIAPVAIQQGASVARSILQQVCGLDPERFCYRDPGAMVTIGRNKAVARLAGRTFTGFPAWVIWLTVHLMKLVGLRNRLLVLINWAWDYLLYERAERLILPQRRAQEGETTDAPTKTATATQVNA